MDNMERGEKFSSTAAVAVATVAQRTLLASSDGASLTGCLDLVSDLVCPYSKSLRLIDVINTYNKARSQI